jgi:hypothetical protein
MSARRHGYTIRITKAQSSLVTEYALGLGLPEYQARIRIFECGLTATFGGQTGSPKDDTSTLLVEIIDRLSRLERLAERTLYTTASAYAHARCAALRGTSNPQSLNDELSEASMDAYRRQLEIARGGS